MIIFVNGLNRWEDANNTMNGRTVADFLDADETLVAQLLGLGGGESVEVSSNNGPFVRADTGYVARSGDTFRFTVQAGEKGTV